MNRFGASILSIGVLLGGCSTYDKSNNKNNVVEDLYPGAKTGKMRIISAQEAREKNVAHMLVRFKGKVVGICHFGKVKLPIEEKTQTFIGTAGHCIDHRQYQNPNGTINNRIDYVLATSLTNLFPKGSGFDVATTDTPRTLERSELYGHRLDGANVEISGCLPHGDGKNFSTCFNFNGTVQMREGPNGQATVFFERNDYIDLLKRAKRNCNDAYISGVSGNYFTDEYGKMVGYVSTGINACHVLFKEKALNAIGVQVRVNAFPVTFEPMRHPMTNGNTRVIIN